MSSKKGTVDPINILKQFYVENKTIKKKDNQLYFDGIKLNIKTETGN